MSAWTDSASSILSALMQRVRAAGKVARDILREIFDESAYERFLVRNHLSACAETYATFCAEHNKSKGRRPRCC